VIDMGKRVNPGNKIKRILPIRALSFLSGHSRRYNFLNASPHDNWANIAKTCHKMTDFPKIGSDN
jgi:hypothetical protein